MMTPYILVRLKTDTPLYFVRGRRLCRHSLHGNLHSLPHADALRLVEAGKAKLLPHCTLHRLREDVARHAAAA